MQVRIPRTEIGKFVCLAKCVGITKLSCHPQMRLALEALNSINNLIATMTAIPMII